MAALTSFAPRLPGTRGNTPCICPAVVALDHLVGELKAGVGDLRHRELLVVGFFGRDDGGVRGQGEVDAGVRHQVGLEFDQVDVQGPVKSQGSRDGGDNLPDETVEVRVGWALDVQVSVADVVDGFVVHHEGTVRVLQGGVGGQDGVVRLHHGGGDLRGGIHREFQLGLLAVFDREPFHQERREAGSSAAAEAVEDQETLKAAALDGVNDLFADGVVASSVIVGSVFLAADQLLRVEEGVRSASSPVFIEKTCYLINSVEFRKWR
ncbi:hypothetical protein E2320_004389 [Naja naja]|nr:hypothetical protein E2320_004389 [Naja naja]